MRPIPQMITRKNWKEFHDLYLLALKAPSQSWKNFDDLRTMCADGVEDGKVSSKVPLEEAFNIDLEKR